MNTFIYNCDYPMEGQSPVQRPSPAIFFDRDGTLIEERHYLKSVSDIRILPGVLQGLRKLHFTGLPLYIITNQAGVAHGFFSEELLSEIHLYLIKLFERQSIHFKGILYCPHHPRAEVPFYQRDCFCRKPNPGLILKAAQLENLDLKTSYVVGDKLIDIQAGKRGKTKTILTLTGYGKSERTRITDVSRPDFIAVNFNQAVNFILKDWNHQRHLDDTSEKEIKLS